MKAILFLAADPRRVARPGRGSGVLFHIEEVLVKLATLGLFALLSASMVPRLASAQIEIPVSWGGIWLIDGEERECGTDTLLDTYTDDPDTLCPGPYTEEGDCSGTVTDTDADFTCSSSFEVVPGCTATTTTIIQVTRTGDTYSGTTQFSITYVEDTPGDCLGAEDECSYENISADRTSTDTSSCTSMPVLPDTWGALKARYE
jgi:hypothetical protein